MLPLLITTEEADSYNKDSSEWLELSATSKTNFIYDATIHMRLNWSCTGVDWEDVNTINDDLKRACAYYAEASRLKILYAPFEPTEKRRAVVEITDEFVEGMRNTKKFAGYGALVTGNPLEKVNRIMRIYCTPINPEKLTRV